jgi:hypothetical protein
VTRIWLALATLLSLWLTPATAGASVGAVAPEQDRVLRAAAEYAHDLARTTTGLEMLRSLEAPAVQVVRTVHRSATHSAHPGLDFHVPVGLVRSWSSVEAGWNVRLAHGEHLPYFPTAPPTLG